MIEREFHWHVTGWRASVVTAVLVVGPVTFLVGCGFLLGRAS